MVVLASALRRWYRWKFSGFITVPIIAVLIIGAVYYQQSTVEFFNNWSCETLVKYTMDEDTPRGMITYEELSEKQHNLLHQFLKECQDNNRFSTPINHLIDSNP